MVPSSPRPAPRRGAGGLVGLLVAVVGAAAVGRYLAATRATDSLDGGPAVVTLACLGAVAGSLAADADGDRAAEFLLLLLPSLLALFTVASLAAVAVPAFPPTLAPLVAVPLALGVTASLTYGARTTLHRRLLGG